jgi:glycosyltransferase involved in cell wall biosynthesis
MKMPSPAPQQSLIAGALFAPVGAGSFHTFEHMVNGRLLPADPEAFAAALADLVAGDPADWAAMSAAARATAEANDLPLAMARFEAALRRIVDGEAEAS